MRWEDIRPEDLTVNLEQKGVDMRIGVDISSLAFKRQVDRIILVSGDSDFVPAAKQARREGIDFILDPMGSHIEDELFEHIDGLQTRINWLKKKSPSLLLPSPK
ncbi:NYN domain-containing protein [uncultured Parasutterella sp.]|uniref:NYN domain-containing protein n=2 Tax=Parasutterella TaxID=577310 RepID=UPI00351BECC3